MSFLFADDSFDKEKVNKNLLKCINECKQIYGKGNEIVSENDSLIFELCRSFELIFLNGLRAKPLSDFETNPSPTATIQQFFQVNLRLGPIPDPANAWSFIKCFLTKEEQERFALLKNIWTYSGLFRAWIRSCLNEKSLNRFIEHMLHNDSLLLKYYCDDAFIRDNQKTNFLPDLIFGLNSISFVINIDRAELNDGKKVQDEPIILCTLPEKVKVVSKTVSDNDSQNEKNDETESEKKSRSSNIDDNDSQSSSISCDNDDHLLNNEPTKLLTIQASSSGRNLAIIEPNEKDNDDIDVKYDIHNSSENIEMASDISAVLTLIEERNDNEIKKLQKQIADLQLENLKLQEHLKKYVDGVKSLKKNSDNCDFDDSELAQAYEKKLIQIAEIHAEMLEFNKWLQNDIRKKDILIEKYRSELFDIRGPFDDQNEFYLGSTCNFVSIWVPSAFLTGSGSKSHHVYQIYIKAGDDDWNIYRRYSQFHMLHCDLKKIDPIVSTFGFPPKKKLRNKDEFLVEKRRCKFQNYLRKIISHWPELSKCSNRTSLEQKLDFFKYVSFIYKK